MLEKNTALYCRHMLLNKKHMVTHYRYPRLVSHCLLWLLFRATL